MPRSFGLTDLLLLTMAVIWDQFVVVKYATHIFNPVALPDFVSEPRRFLVALRTPAAASRCAA